MNEQEQDDSKQDDSKQNASDTIKQLFNTTNNLCVKSGLHKLMGFEILLYEAGCRAMQAQAILYRLATEQAIKDIDGDTDNDNDDGEETELGSRVS